MINEVIALIPNIGGPEFIIIFLIVLLLFGAKKLPELAKGLGKAKGEFKKAKDEFESEVSRSERSVSDEKAKKKES